MLLKTKNNTLDNLNEAFCFILGPIRLPFPSAVGVNVEAVKLQKCFVAKETWGELKSYDSILIFACTSCNTM